MLTKRIIACLDVDGGRVVKGVEFQNLRDAGDPAELARAHADSGADEIVLLDISATAQKRATLLDTVRRTASQIFVPFTVGGGIRSLDEASAVFDAGCDKLSINSAAVKDPALIACIGERFGSQAVVVAIDARKDRQDSVPHVREANVGSSQRSVPSGYRVFVSGGRIPTERDAVEWAKEAESRGAGEILLTSMDRDGTGIGFECELTAMIASAVSIPVIASGGAGNIAHFVEVFREGKADAALAASIFHFGVHDIRELKQQVSSAGIPMRWPC
jgi:imidazole glycerol-phosphate synthase subunit HisF